MLFSNQQASDDTHDTDLIGADINPEQISFSVIESESLNN